MDVCDPSIAPGVGTPVKGGLDYREAHMLMEIVADSGLLTSLDMVEVNPTLDVRERDRAARDGAGAVSAGDEDSVSRDSASISSSVSTSSTSEYGFSISRVRGRIRSSSADSDGTPEKMMTGTSAGAALTTSRPEPRFNRRSTTAATGRCFAQLLEPLVGGLGGDDGEAVHLEKLHQRPADRDIVFDDEHEASGVLGHGDLKSILNLVIGSLGHLVIALT